MKNLFASTQIPGMPCRLTVLAALMAGLWGPALAFAASAAPVGAEVVISQV